MTPRTHLGEEKKELLSRLLEGVKGCQSRFGSRTELATEDDLSIRKLCFAFEQVFLHGLQKPPATLNKGIWQLTENLVPSGLRSSESLTFWPLVKSQLSKHEAERFLLLHQVRTDLGRGRAWLRASLNEHSLERYILIVLSLDNLPAFYQDFAFLRDDELSSILPQTAAGLGSVLFALCVDNPELDKVEHVMDQKAEEPIAETVPELAEVAEVALHSHPPPLSRTSTHPSSSSSLDIGSPKNHSARKPRKKKKIPTTFVSFDDERGRGVSPEQDPTPLSQQPHLLPELRRSKSPSIEGPQKSISSVDDETDVVPRSALIERVRSARIEIGPTGSSLKSADSLSIYSDCSDRLDIDNLSLSGVSPSQRLKPVGSDLDYASGGDQDKDRTNDLIPVPNYSNDEGESEPNSVSGGKGKESQSLSQETAEESTAERIHKLKAILDHEVEMVTSLKAQLAHDKRTHNDQVKILETRIETLSKENELLKHQLKKYIGAVQLLKEGGRRSSLDLDDVPDPPNPQNDEPSMESAEYERKLIQVAEMHGELMEFNAYLQGVLQRKDNAIRTLREELVDLRGPFVLPMTGTEDDSATDQESNLHSSPARQLSRSNERVLINIWIPSAFLTGATNDLHHVYQVFLRIKDTEWNVYRRYSQFYSLHRDLRKRETVVDAFSFPPKKHIGNKDTKFVEERRRKLQDYLRKVINHTLQTNTILASHPDKNLLISILPFFGEISHQKPRRERSRTRNLFFRQSESSSHEASGYPQYTGL